MSNHIWTAKTDEVAVRMTLGDISGFFSKQLLVSRGTNALVIDGETHLGVVPPGTYTLKSFFDKLKFWQSAKQVDVMLVRDDDLRLELQADQVPTAEELFVAVRLQPVIRIQDVSLFAKNLLGNRTTMTVPQLCEWITPIMTQAIRESIRQLDIESLTSPDVRPILFTAIQDAAKTSLSRYGIVCDDIHAVEIVHDQYDENRRKAGESRLDEKEAFRKIEQRERELELNTLAEHVEIDTREAEVALAIRRNDVRKNMRDALLSNTFDKVKTREEFEMFMLEIDKRRLLREDERDELQKTFDAKKEDHDLLRTHLARQLELRRNAELTEENQANELRWKQQKDEYEDERKRRDHERQQEMMTDQMRQLRQMEEMNREKDLFQAELLQKAATHANTLQIEKLEALEKVNVETLIATSETENAKILGDVEISKHESTIREQAMQHERELQDKRIQDARVSNGTTLEIIQKITGQAFEAVSHFGDGGKSERGSGSMSLRVLVCLGCRAENPQDAKFCGNCGKKL